MKKVYQFPSLTHRRFKIKRNYTDLDIINNSKTVFSLAGLIKSLNLRIAGGNYDTVKRKLAKLDIDTSHWTKQLWSKERQLKDYKEYVKSSSLKKHLIIDRGHRCEMCLNHEWLNRIITLELHHIDGNNKNNQENNLQLLCPNCHSTTDNWRNRKRLSS